MNSNELKTSQKAEALARMKMLNLYPNIIKEFDKENIVNLSKNGGILYWLNDKQKNLVSKFSKNTTLLCIMQYTVLQHLGSIFLYFM